MGDEPGAMAADDPQALLDALAGRAERIETPCGEGTMVWHVWGPVGAEPLVLGHGAQGSWQHWVRNIDRLAATRRVIAADLPGHGDSALPATPDHAGIAKALAEGLERIVDAPADLCGFSFGGVCFAHLAACHPQVARRLVLVGCGGLDTPHGAVHLQRVSGLRGEERTAVLRANLLGLMLHHPASADALAVHMLLPNAKRARLFRTDLVLPDKLLRILPQVRCRVDAIWGEFDRPHPDPAVQEAALLKVCPEAGFAVVPDAGHWAMYERPEAFERALDGMLREPG